MRLNYILHGEQLLWLTDLAAAAEDRELYMATLVVLEFFRLGLDA